MSDDKTDKPKEDISLKLREQRLRLEGGGTLSKLEHDEIDIMNSRIALVCAQYTKSIPLTMQSLSELLLSAIAHISTDEKNFNKNVYTFMKDYWFPQSQKMAAIIMLRQEQVKSENIRGILDKLYRKFGECDTNNNLQDGVILSGTVEKIAEQLKNFVELDECPCPKCVERRKLENIGQNNPNLNTKH